MKTLKSRVVHWVVLGSLTWTFLAENASSADAPVPASNPVVEPGVPALPEGLRWKEELQEERASLGQEKAHFSFTFTNPTPAEIVITSARSSCFCTVAKLPQEPWPIPSGGTGTIEVDMDLHGKRGTLEKPVTVETSQGKKILKARVHIPEASRVGGNTGPLVSERTANMQAALQDRQIVFKNADCAKCHAEPAQGKTDGEQLYAAVCSNCHDSPNRAPMVPDLRKLSHPTDATHWRKWISGDMPGTLMPGFSTSKGGPLSDAQIEALVQYLDRTITRLPAAAPTGPAP